MNTDRPRVCDSLLSQSKKNGAKRKPSRLEGWDGGWWEGRRRALKTSMSRGVGSPGQGRVTRASAFCKQSKYILQDQETKTNKLEGKKKTPELKASKCGWWGCPGLVPERGRQGVGLGAGLDLLNEACPGLSWPLTLGECRCLSGRDI